jgi:hypothetical protein
MEAGVTTIEDNNFTVKIMGELIIPDSDAVIFVVPIAMPVTIASESMVATELSELVHFTCVLMSLFKPFEYIPKAEKDSVEPTAKSVGKAGNKEIEVNF